MTNLVKNITPYNTQKGLPWLKQVTDACPHGLYSKFRAEIIFRCGWGSASTYTHKLRGVSDCTLPERVVIKDVCKKYGLATFCETETVKS